MLGGPHYCNTNTNTQKNTNTNRNTIYELKFNIFFLLDYNLFFKSEYFLDIISFLIVTDVDCFDHMSQLSNVPNSKANKCNKEKHLFDIRGLFTDNGQ